jgi:hypothetical protein
MARRRDGDMSDNPRSKLHESIHVITQLRQVVDALPKDAHVGLNISHRMNFDHNFEPVPAHTTEIFLLINGNRHSFYVKDEEWEQETIAGEIIDHMNQQLGISQ